MADALDGAEQAGPPPVTLPGGPYTAAQARRTYTAEAPPSKQSVVCFYCPTVIGRESRQGQVALMQRGGNSLVVHRKLNEACRVPLLAGDCKCASCEPYTRAAAPAARADS